MNLAAVRDTAEKFPDLEAVFIEFGGDNLSSTFSLELADITFHVINVCAGDKIPSKGGPGITRSDFLVINKIELAPQVGADLGVMDRDTRRMHGERPFVFTNVKKATALKTLSASSCKPVTCPSLISLVATNSLVVAGHRAGSSRRCRHIRPDQQLPLSR